MNERHPAMVVGQECRRYRAFRQVTKWFVAKNNVHFEHLARNKSGKGPFKFLKTRICFAATSKVLQNSRKFWKHEVFLSGNAVATNKSLSKKIAQLSLETSCRLREISHAQLRVKGGFILAGVSSYILDEQTRANRERNPG